jgi:8-oxo-dGTP pyrophosphatase MutT (NUDIX family)
MNKETKKKVVVYAIQNNKILVFRHVDFSYEEVGIQVPAGSVKEYESLEDAVLRELVEETGFMDFEIIAYLGSANYDMSPYRNEIHERHFYYVKTTNELPDRWFSKENHDGSCEPTNFECFFIPLERGHVLQAGQSAFIWKVQELFNMDKHLFV